MKTSRYADRGVSASKKEVHQAIQNVDKGLHKNAFCQIFPDHLSGDRDFCNVIHADGAGTKSVLAYMYWKETGDNSVWKGIAQDAIVMNIDDLMCIGIHKGFLMSSIINRNKHLIPGEVIKHLIEGSQEVVETINEYGLDIHLMGGETADVGDLVRTIIVDAVMTCRWPRKKLITNERIKGGQVIVGLSSTGKASYEHVANSGMGSNGLTSARHEVLSNHYALKYPECFDPNTPSKLVYCGNRRLTDEIEGLPENLGKSILSPTRTYAPILKQIFTTLDLSTIGGIIHCSGGAQTKVMKYVNNVHVIKDNLFEVPPLFDLIQKASNTSNKEMYEVFNMGHRMEIYTNEESARAIIDISNSFNIEAKIIGRVQTSKGNNLTIKTKSETFNYN